MLSVKENEECLFSPSSSDDEFSESEEEIEEENVQPSPQVNNTSSSMTELVQQTNENFHILYDQIINKPSLNVMITPIDFKKDTVDEQEITEMFHQLQENWFFKEWKQLTPELNILLCIKNLNLSRRDLKNSDLIEKAYGRQIYTIIALKQQFSKIDKLDQEKENTFQKILEIVYYGYLGLMCGVRMKMAMNPTYESNMNDDTIAYKFAPLDIEKLDSKQNLILYALNVLAMKQFRRYQGDKCYKKIYSPNNWYTHAWKKATTIDKFLHDIAKKEINGAQWKNLTAKDNAKKTLEYLKTCEDYQFPDLKKDRHVFSFRNGVYITNMKKDGKYYDYFHTYGTMPRLSDTLVTAKYFDLDFDNFDEIEDWRNIETPNLEKVLRYQYEDEQEKETIIHWFYIFLGRLVFEVGEIDDWQIIPFIRGVAGCGKSTILMKVVKEFYDKDDVGVLDNTIEKQFGLSSLVDKYIFIAPEIKEDLQLPQTSFQSMVSGEDVSISIKHKTAEFVQWKIPGIMAGNDNPGYIDNGGSLARRFATFAFLRPVDKKKSDPELGKKIKLEIPIILKKSVKAYLQTVNDNRGKDIWAILPQYFKKHRDELAEQTNGLIYFLRSEDYVEFGKTNYCKMNDFVTQYSQFCKTNSYLAKKMNKNLFQGPFYNLSIEKGYKVGLQINPTIDGKIHKGKYLMGIRLKDPSENVSDSENEYDEEIDVENICQIDKDNMTAI
jgi:phage/plasmid-associated DNA primase